MVEWAKYQATAEAWLAKFNKWTYGTNWYRLAFIFLPAIIRGDIFSSVSLYLPFVFGYLLRRCVRQCSAIFEATDDVYCTLKISHSQYMNWVWKAVFELAVVLTFLVVCHFMKAETRILVNFFIAGFVCPMIRAALKAPHRGPLIKGRPLWDETWGELVVQIFIILGLVLSWLYQGMDQLFLGFLFLLAIPQLQDRLWWKPEKHGYLVLAVLACCLPFFSVGIVSRFFPSYLSIFPKFYLKILCVLSNVQPLVKDYYAVLGLNRDADMKTIRRVFRQMSLELHPDKVGDDPIAAERFNQVREASDALTKQRAAYDKAIENVELNDMAPRCEAFMIMMYFWILHSLIDWVQVEDAIIAMKKQLREYILQDRKLDTNSIGIEPEAECRKVLKSYCDKEDVELPSLPARAYTTGGREDIERMRELLTGCGVDLKPYIEVNGIVNGLHQEFVLLTDLAYGEAEGGGISTTEGFYSGWELTIDGKDINTGKASKATRKVIAYRSARRVVTVAEPLGFDAEPGKAKFVLKKGRDEVKGMLGFHVYGHSNQVMTLGEGQENQKFQWNLSKEANYYTGHKFEVYNGETYVGWQRVHEYLPEKKMVILKGPIALMGEERPEAGKTRYKMFPDQIIPQNNATPFINREDPAE
mmetsp:Transcript_42652/g.106741  ORF Transcript_42652/g.106741 Transcript_42652/m.106741 type:complete len:642 (-) Transcript_42652:177-2102(-)